MVCAILTFMASKKIIVEAEKVKERLGTVRKNRKYSLLVGVVIVLGVLYLLKGVFVVAMVNGSPVFRYSVVRQLEKQGGSDVLEGLIVERLMEQEAKKQGISVLPKEVDEEIVKIADQLTAQGQDLDQVLTLQGMTRDDLAKQVRLQKIVEKVFAGQITVTDEDIAGYLETYADSLGTDMTEEEKKAAALEQLKQQKLAESYYGWIDGLKSAAKINYLVNY